MSITQLPSANDRVVLEAAFPELTPQQLYDHFTQPELLTKWWSSEAETDLKIGGVYCLSWPQMNWNLRGKYTIVESGKLLSYTWKWDHEPDMPARDVTVFFAPDGGGSTLWIVHGYYGDDESEQKDRQSHLDGWLHFLAQLQEMG